MSNDFNNNNNFLEDSEIKMENYEETAKVMWRGKFIILDQDEAKREEARVNIGFLEMSKRNESLFNWSKGMYDYWSLP